MKPAPPVMSVRISVEGGWWLVAGGWCCAEGGWWLVAGGRCKRGKDVRQGGNPVLGQPATTDHQPPDPMSHRSVRTFTVLPCLPERLRPLQKLAYNLWMGWNHEAVALFRRIDTRAWEEVGHSPVK